MYLYLDTTERDSFQIALVEKGTVLKHKTILSVRQYSEKLLKAINSLLNPSFKPHPNPLLSKERGLRGIAVVKGPGSFTSLRVGIATANALSFALGVPVVGVKPDFPLEKVAGLFKKPSKKGIVLPKYGQSPNIGLKAK